MIDKDQVQNIRIKRLKIIFPLIALALVSLIFFQSINIKTEKEDKNLNLILSKLKKLSKLPLLRKVLKILIVPLLALSVIL